MSKKIDKTFVCADDKKIQEVVQNFGGECHLTSKSLKNGTERIASFLEQNKKIKNIKLVVDIQCDEVFLNPNDIDKLINFHLKNYDKFDVVIETTMSEGEDATVEFNGQVSKFLKGTVRLYINDDAPVLFVTPTRMLLKAPYIGNR